MPEQRVVIQKIICKTPRQRNQYLKRLKQGRLKWITNHRKATPFTVGEAYEIREKLGKRLLFNYILKFSK